MTTLTAMRGYSGSGKSTRAAEIAKETGAVVVNRDLLRLMLLGSYWTGKKLDEDRVTLAEETQVESFLRNGTNVCVDSTHINPSYLRKWARMATRLGIDFTVVSCVADVHDCIDRDYERGANGERAVGRNVILKQAKQWPMEKWPQIVAKPFDIVPVGEYDDQIPDAYLFDIDGTLAHMNGRSPYDYSQVKTDTVDETVRELAGVIYDLRNHMNFPWRPRVIIMSGRDDSCRQDTTEWLANNDIQWDEFYMRPANATDNHGNKLPDWMVKYALFDKYLRGRYNVRAVFDDRNQVVDMWRRLGLQCLQVAEGNF